eukprot:6378109-Prymnesium_polylepis.1
MGNAYVTGGRTRPHPSASVRPVRTRPRLRPPVRGPLTMWARPTLSSSNEILAVCNHDTPSADTRWRADGQGLPLRVGLARSGLLAGSGD